MSDDTTYAALTPSSLGDNSHASPATSPAPVIEHGTTPAADSSRRPSQPRPLASAPKSQITTVSAPQVSHGPSPSGGGPIGQSYVIPPRQKPGRKPAVTVADTVRKQQNRESQRNFRRRKQQREDELRKQAEESSSKVETLRQNFERETELLRQQIRELQQTVDFYKQRCETLEGESRRSSAHPHPSMPYSPAGQNGPMLFQPDYAPADHGSMGTVQTTASQSPTNTFGCGTCEPDNCACIRAIANDISMQTGDFGKAEDEMIGVEMTTAEEEDEFKDREIDFTAKFLAQKQEKTQMPSHEMAKTHDCGWCENMPEVCLCKDPTLRPVGDDTAMPSSQLRGSTPVPEVKAKKASGPGSCADCQANPAQRAWCQRVAQLRNEASSSSSRPNSRGSSQPSQPSSRRNSSMSSTPTVLEPKVESRIDNKTDCLSPVISERSIGCSEAFKILDGRVPMDVDHMDWRNLRPIPASATNDHHRDKFTMEPGFFSAMELDASSILSTLQHSRRPLEPRPSDGRLAPLIREAEDMRRATASPRINPVGT